MANQVKCPNCKHQFDADAVVNKLPEPSKPDNAEKTEMIAGEPVVFITRPVLRAFTPRLLGAAFFAFLCIIFFRAFGLDNIIAPAYVWVVFLGLISVNIIYECFSQEYKLTTQRLFIKQGLFSLDYDELELFRVKDVKFNQKITQRFFGVGNITIYSTDESTPELRMINVARPFDLKEKIRKINRVSRKEENITTAEFIQS